MFLLRQVSPESSSKASREEKIYAWVQLMEADSSDHENLFKAK
jgi:hypothetical protein